MKNLKILLIIAILTVLGFFAVRSNYFQYIIIPIIPKEVIDVFFREPERVVSYSITADSASYREYEFDGNINRDSGSWDLLWQVRKDKTTLHEGLAFTENEMDYAEITEADEEKGIIQKYNGYPDIKRLGAVDTYELHSDPLGTSYSMYQNGNLLFKRNIMEYGADGPIIDQRVVDGPAFTVRLSCPVVDSVQTCIHDVFYDGQFMNEKYNVKDSRYLFAYDGKIGFVAEDGDGKDRIFFDGAFITPDFDTIHTENCCSISQILPTVYENGVLLFYGNRDGKDYLVEAKLQPENSWQTYTNDQYGFSLKFPENFQYTILDLKDQYVNEENPDMVFAAIIPDEPGGMMLHVIKKSEKYKNLKTYADQFARGAKEASQMAIGGEVTTTTKPITLASISGFEVSGCNGYCGYMTSIIFLEKGPYIYRISYQYDPPDWEERIKEAGISEESKKETLKNIQEGKVEDMLRQKILTTLSFK